MASRLCSQRIHNGSKRRIGAPHLNVDAGHADSPVVHLLAHPEMRNNLRGWPTFLAVVLESVTGKQQCAGQPVGLVLIALGIFADKQDSGG